MTETTRFWFTYSLIARAPRPGRGVQLHGQAAEITIDDVPETEFQDGLPGPDLMRRAEIEFLSSVTTKHPLQDVTSWQLRYGGPNGPLLSRLRVTMP